MKKIDTVVPLKKRRITLKSLETMLKDNISVMSKDYITLSSNDTQIFERVNELELLTDDLAKAINDIDKGLIKAHKNTNKVWMHLLDEGKPSSAKVVPKHGLLRRAIYSSYYSVVKLLRWLI